MPMVTCACGKPTNTALCQVDDFRDWGKKADRCFAYWDGTKYVKGCGYEKADGFHRSFADKHIERTKS